MRGEVGHEGAHRVRNDTELLICGVGFHGFRNDMGHVLGLLSLDVRTESAWLVEEFEAYHVLGVEDIVLLLIQIHCVVINRVADRRKLNIPAHITRYKKEHDLFNPRSPLLLMMLVFVQISAFLRLINGIPQNLTLLVEVGAHHSLKHKGGDHLRDTRYQCLIEDDQRCEEECRGHSILMH